VLSTDDLVHEIQSDPTHIAAFVEKFGPQVEAQGQLDRGALASAAFSSEDGRKWLEGYMWPLVGDGLMAWIKNVDALEPAPRFGVVEVPLLFESGMDEAFDKTLCVLAEEGVRSERARARGHAAVDERSARQLSQAEKAERADLVVINDGSEGDLEAALSDLLGEMDG
jgi:dephospho-CoA kinase